MNCPKKYIKNNRSLVSLYWNILFGVNILVNALKPGAIPEKMYANPPTMSIKQMKLIDKALENIKRLGLPDHEMFTTVHLHNAQNLHQVVITLNAVARKVRH